MPVSGTSSSTSGWVVNDAIRGAAQSTGTSFDYLLATAKVESDLNPNAASTTSSARGLFQFIDQTWLMMLKEAGTALGFGQYADAITKTASGRYEVTDPSLQQAVMNLRGDAGANAVMAGAFTQRNAAKVEALIGRAPNEGELYIAHFLGPGGAARLITEASRNPSGVAAETFPNAAAANPSIFYERDGTARSFAQVYGNLVGRYDRAVAGTAAMTGNAAAGRSGASGPVVSVAPAGQGGDRRVPATATANLQTEPARTVATGPLFHSLFQSGPERGAVSDIVSELWSTRPHVAAALSGVAAQATPRTVSGTTPVAAVPAAMARSAYTANAPASAASPPNVAPARAPVITVIPVTAPASPTRPVASSAVAYTPAASFPVAPSPVAPSPVAPIPVAATPVAASTAAPASLAVPDPSRASELFSAPGTNAGGLFGRRG
ncbi:transglycosylase SLT domain-containing protein [Rhodoplanes elegans]|uniref:transglycosylase SLT domain-containing protein n=1 Tax=Rhodoplanes elegans TaxID=29408 RepID=UPI001914B36F|nr:transglycosylase SLT domain-containing protein [Rhodoplanes elegans]